MTPAHPKPAHGLTVAGAAVTSRASWAIAATTASAVAAPPASTSSTPSRPTETVILAPAPTSMNTFPRTGSTCSAGAGDAVRGGVWPATVSPPDASSATASVDSIRPVMAGAPSP